MAMVSPAFNFKMWGMIVLNVRYAFAALLACILYLAEVAGVTR